MEAREKGDARLGHADDGTGDATAQRKRSGETDGEVGAVVVAREVVVGERGAAEDEVLLEEDARVDGEPVRQEDEKCVERVLERGVAGLGEDDVCEAEGQQAGARTVRLARKRERRTDDGAEDAQEETRDPLGVLAERLERQSERVDVLRGKGSGRHGRERQSGVGDARGCCWQRSTARG